MPHTQTHAARRAFSLAELAVLITTLALLAAFLLLAAAEQRRRSRLAAGLDNFRFFASGTESYAADHNDEFWQFTWRKNVSYGPGIPVAPDDMAAMANQATMIVRERSDPFVTFVPSWVPGIEHSHLVLLEHLGTELPIPQVASPEDRLLLTWQRNFLQQDFAELTIRPTGPGLWRFPYRSSYETGPAFWSRDAATIINGQTHPAVSQADTVWRFNVPGSQTSVGPVRRRDELRFPADKAHMWDGYQRHFGPQVLHFGYTDARLPVLMADGSASIRSMSSVNGGFNPAIPHNPTRTFSNYQPAFYQPPTRNGTASETVRLHLRYTRWGLRGRDFNGPEVTAP